MNAQRQILATKLYMPRPITTLVTRPRLLDQLELVLYRPLTTVIASPGTGKTTLVATWAAKMADDNAASIAWLTLDAHDDDPSRFWTAFVAALQTIDPLFEHDLLPLMSSTTPASSEYILLPLINQLAEFATTPIVLVLDDYHEINLPAILNAQLQLATGSLDDVPRLLGLATAALEQNTLPPSEHAAFRGGIAAAQVHLLLLDEQFEQATSLAKQALEVLAANQRASRALASGSRHYYVLGTNDLKARFGLTAFDIAQGVGVLASTAQHINLRTSGVAPTVLLLAPPPLGKLTVFAEMFEGAVAKSHKFADYYHAVADDHACAFFDTSTVIASSDIDGIHFEKSEHAKLGNVLAGKVRELIG